MTTTKQTLDFIVIGAQKAGTTSLFEYLRRHPEISLPANKEAPYFSHDAVYERGWKHFLNKAALSDPTTKWGTVSPQYMVGGVAEPAVIPSVNTYDERTVPRRIRKCLPDVRMVAILRDPVERAFSHYQMMVMNGFERRPFAEAVLELLSPDSLNQSRRYPQEINGYVTWGEYGRILGGYFDTFPSHQLLVTFTDELERTPEQLLFRIQDFLGVTANLAPDNLGTRYRVGGSERRLSWMSPYRKSSPQGIQRTAERSAIAQRLWHTLPEATRVPLRRRYESLGYRVDLWNRRDRPATIDIDPDTSARLRDHFTRDAQLLTALLGTSPPWQC